MKKAWEKTLTTALTLCAVLSAFYLRGEGEDPAPIPVERVFAAVSPAPDLFARREEQRRQEMDALSTRADQAEALRALVERAETELAVEQALAALGHDRAVCALRREAASICVAEPLTAEDAARICALCARLAGIPEENVFILDECAYL